MFRFRLGIGCFEGFRVFWGWHLGVYGVGFSGQRLGLGFRVLGFRV